MIQSAVMGALSVVIGGDVSGLDKAAAKAEGIVGKLGRSINSGAVQLAAYSTAAVTAGAALAVSLTAKSMETIDVQSKLAYRLNGTVAQLQGLVYAGDLAGVSQETLAQNIGKMNQRLAEAARTGSGPAYEALKRLGLGASDFLALPVDERLATLADRFKALGYTTAQQSDVLKQFGIRGQEIISLFEGGGDSIRSASKDVEAFGVAISDIDAAEVEAANDAWTTAKLALTGVANQMAVHLAPLIKVIAEEFSDAGRGSKGFSEAIGEGVRLGILAFGKLRREIYQTRIDFDDLPAGLIGAFDKAAGAIPKGIESATGGAVTAAQLGYHDIAHGFGKLKDTLEKPPSDEEWDKWWTDVKAKAKAAAEEVVAQRKKANDKPGDTGDGMDTGERKAIEARLDRLRKSLASESEALQLQRDEELKNLAEFEAKKILSAQDAAALRIQIEDKFQKDKQALIQSKFEEGVLAEDDLLARKYEKQLADLAAFEANRTITVERAAELRRKIEEKSKLAMLQLQASQYSAAANIVDTSMGQITDLIGTEGDKQFSIFKAISLATALVKGYEAVVSAYAAGAKLPGGPVTGALFAGIAAAGVAAHIAKLMSVNVGSGGGTVSSAGGGAGSGEAAAAAQPAEPAAPSRTTFVTFQGRYFGREEVRELAGQLLEFQSDGGRVVLA